MLIVGNNTISPNPDGKIIFIIYFFPVSISAVNQYVFYFRSTCFYSIVVIEFNRYSKKISEYTSTYREQHYKSQPRWYIYISFPVSISAVNQYVYVHYYVIIIGRQINTFPSLLCIAICSQANTLQTICQCLKIRSCTG